MKIITFEVYAVANLFDGALPIPARNECAGMRELMNTFHVDNFSPRVLVSTKILAPEFAEFRYTPRSN